MNKQRTNLPSIPTTNPFPDLTGTWPDREVGLLCAAANLAFLAAWSHYHPKAAIWQTALVVLVCLLFVPGFLLLLRINARNRTLREVWVEQESVIYNAIGEISGLLISAGDNHHMSGSLIVPDTKWDELARDFFADYHPVVSAAMKRDVRNLDVVDRVREQIMKASPEEITSGLSNEIFLKLHKRYVNRVRFDGLLLLLSLAVANVAWMIIWW